MKSSIFGVNELLQAFDLRWLFQYQPKVAVANFSLGWCFNVFRNFPHQSAL